jgi:D-sedoheptulose 7-phosphate isomerase
MDCWKRDGKILIAGNGGSAADAMHFAEELVVRFSKNRRALAAIALTDPTVITCAGNDFGFQTIFERQLHALGRPGDLFIAMTTSGNSPNILAAMQAAKKQGLATISFTGKDGGQIKDLADIELLVPSNNTARIQEIHQLLFHALCQWIDQQVD